MDRGSTTLDRTATPGFFDFLGRLGYDADGVSRMNARHRFVVDAVRSELAGARLLDLGSHDGRWPFAYASAGAESVLGIEGRADLIAKFSEYPDTPAKARVTLVCGDFIDEMREMSRAGRRFDVVACLGVFYHTMHHYMMLVQMTSFRPKLIIIDSTFHLANFPTMRMAREKTEHPLNTIAQTTAQAWAPVGSISRPALEMMAESLGYAVSWADWSQLPESERLGVSDYFGRPKLEARNVRRFTAYLRPRAA